MTASSCWERYRTLRCARYGRDLYFSADSRNYCFIIPVGFSERSHILKLFFDGIILHGVIGGIFMRTVRCFHQGGWGPRSTTAVDDQVCCVDYCWWLVSGDLWSRRGLSAHRSQWDTCSDKGNVLLVERVSADGSRVQCDDAERPTVIRDSIFKVR